MVDAAPVITSCTMQQQAEPVPNLGRHIQTFQENLPPRPSPNQLKFSQLVDGNRESSREAEVEDTNPSGDDLELGEAKV